MSEVELLSIENCGILKPAMDSVISNKMGWIKLHNNATCRISVQTIHRMKACSSGFLTLNEDQPIF